MSSRPAEGTGSAETISSDAAGQSDASDHETSNPSGGRKPPKLALRKRNPTSDNANMSNTMQQQGQQQQQQQNNPNMGQLDTYENPFANGPALTSRGRKIIPVHESRIKDRPEKVGEKDSSLKIKIELDLEVEVELYARVKGDVTIGLM